MKLILLMILLLTSCATKQLEEKSYAERTSEENQEYIDKQIEESKELSRSQKDYYKIYTRCMANLMQNPHTIDNLMLWQRQTLHIVAREECKTKTLDKLEGRH